MSGLIFILTGFGIVIAVLTFLWAVCVLVGWLHKDRRPPMPASSERPGPAEAPVPAAHLAAISAAIAAVLPGRHRIIKVYAPGHKSSAWIEEGRFEISSSHRVRWDWAAPGPAMRSDRGCQKDNNRKET